VMTVIGIERTRTTAAIGFQPNLRDRREEGFIVHILAAACVAESDCYLGVGTS